jgi:phosphomannomutase
VGATTGLQEIAAAAERLDGPKAGAFPLKGSYGQKDLWAGYRKHILSFLTPLPKPIKVFIDGSNGMAGKMVPAAFEGVPNLEIVPVNFEITGRFVHQPNPLVAENMVQTQEGVRAHHAALGACFDGDADRCIMTDERGRIIGCDHLTALLCGHFLAQAPGAAVVYDLRSSKAVMEEVRRLGGVPLRSRVGHVFMKALLREKGGIFGGELSGHFYFRDNFCADSGAIALAAMLSVLGASAKPLSELIAPFQKYPQSGEVNFRVEDKAGVLAKLREKFGKAAAIDDLDGITLDAWNSPARGGVRGGWWCNVRASNTEPLLRLNAEAKDRATLDWLLHEVEPMLGAKQTGE